MRIMSGLADLFAILLLPNLASAEGVLDRIAKAGEIRLAYRADAAPFSSLAEGAAEPEGYSIELCRAVAESAKAELKLAELKIAYVKVTAEDRFEAITGFAQLESGALAAYFADRTILQFMLMKRNQNGKLLLADQFLSFEPYALAMPRDADFRLEVDRALSRLFRNGGGRNAFAKVFGGDAKATGLQSSLYVTSGLPE